nr:hypothetical protein [Tanacetum cinerariifolium]
MAEFLRLPNFKGCKITAGALLPPGAARGTYLAPSANRLEDIPPKSGEMLVAEIPCQKALDDKERKKRKAEEKTVAHAPVVNTQAEVAVPKGAGGEGRRKKKRVHIQLEVVVVSDQVSSPNPLNQAQPLETLADEGHVSSSMFAGWMDNLKDHLDEHVSSPLAALVTKLVAGVRGEEGADDNEGVLSGLQARPSPAPPFGHRLKAMEEPASEVAGPEAEAKSSSMDKSRDCRDMMSNLFTPADEEFFNEGTSAYENLSKNYDGALTREKSLQDRVEELEEEKEKEKREGEMVRHRIVNEYLLTFVCRLHQSVEYKWSLGEGYLRGYSNVDHAAFNTFMDAYEKLFDRRYPYVEKVSRMYLLDPSNLQNIMPYETGPTPGAGPRDTPTASYA